MVTLARPLAKRLPFYYGWIVVWVSGFVAFSGAGLAGGVVGVVFKPMSEELGWGRSVIPAAIFVGSVLVVVFAPIAGRLTDKYGARMVTVVGATIMAASMVLLALTQSILMYLVVYGIGFCMFNVLYRVILTAATAQWFVRKRGAATSIVNILYAFGMVVLPLITVWVITIWDWRGAWAAIGGFGFLLAVPASLLLLVRQPSDVGQHLDGDDPGKTSSAGQARQQARSAITEVQWTTKEAMRTPTMWMLMVGLSVHAMAVSGVQIHLISHLQDRGMTALVATLSYTIGGSVMTLTGYFWGQIADRFQTRYVYAIAALIFIVYQSAIMAATNIWWVILIGVSQGLGFGGYLLVTRTIFANYYGRRSAGAIQGIVTPVQVLVGGGGALVAGAIFDMTGTYMVAFGTFLGLLVLAVIIVLLAPRPVKESS